ncbi:MAG TPA: HNH endonuclease signature motif containing protein, partial [Thermoanaerobaculia bacterium]|nr:HNH endonuclease signature motif containing protein [Thermoanaerobaculia bacterium]
KLCDAHHVEHWADGGETSLTNMLLLCRRHHRAVHEEGFTLELAPDGAARFYRPDGQPLAQAPTLPVVAGEPVAGLVSRLASRGVAVAARETLPSWWGGPVDYGWEIEWLTSRRDRPSPATAAR